MFVNSAERVAEECLGEGGVNLTQRLGVRQKLASILVYPKFGIEKKVYSCDVGYDLSIGRAAQNTIIIPDDVIDLYHCKIIHNNMSEHFLQPNLNSIKDETTRSSKSSQTS